MAAPRSSTHKGWFHDEENSELDLYYGNGGACDPTQVMSVTASQIGLVQNLVPKTSDGAALGTASLMFSDLFLASGSVVNFNNGDVTITHSSNNIAVAGGSLTASGGLVVTGTTTLGACAVAYTWPAADGCCGQQLTTDGSAGLSWAAASTAEYKFDLGALCKYQALDAIRTTPVHRFTYDQEKLPRGQWGCQVHEMTGIFAEEAPWAMQGRNKRAFSPINSFGYAMGAIQALDERVTALEANA